MPESRPDLPKQVRICQHTACRRAGSERVFAAFQNQAPKDWQILDSSCLGHCGNGPMVWVLPDDIRYHHVLPEEVGAIATRHLLQGKPIAAMHYPRRP
ncbi:MAG: (2Fe-2S) ferredoxin domain-containing protein [Leptolyngbya sp. DLM2.Bin15]|nr:MAG: (2Fe-2S) ferredoxin domain-containing protein [Leptolyngbya sp. DLM2.Bin15]